MHDNTSPKCKQLYFMIKYYCLAVHVNPIRKKMLAKNYISLTTSNKTLLNASLQLAKTLSGEKRRFYKRSKFYRW